MKQPGRFSFIVACKVTQVSFRNFSTPPKKKKKKRRRRRKNLFQGTEISYSKGLPTTCIPKRPVYPNKTVVGADLRYAIIVCIIRDVSVVYYIF